MKNRIIKTILCSVLAFGLVSPNAFPVYAEKPVNADFTPG